MVFTTPQSECVEGRKKVALQAWDRFLLREGKRGCDAKSNAQRFPFPHNNTKKK